MEFAFCHPCGAKNVEVTSRFFKSCAPLPYVMRHEGRKIGCMNENW